MMETRRVRVKVDGAKPEFPKPELLRLGNDKRAERVLSRFPENRDELWLPGPCLTSRLMCFLLRFRERAAGASSDITWMFHQVQLLPGDKA